MPFVLDASMALAWHFDDESEPIADAISERSTNEQVVVPAHWFAEMANGLLAGERRGRTAPDRVVAFVHRLDKLDLEVDGIGPADTFGAVLPLARAHRLTIYDALYLELAERRGLALATLDGELAAAARSVGVEVLP
jgi:predicted nucleic acid-binding protein